jgi:uncharacterized protein (PEP-CTERM system associated)
MAARRADRIDHRRHVRRSFLAAALPVLLGIAQPSQAGEWKLEPDVAFGASFTDNVTLASPGGEQAAWVLQAAPGIRARYEGSSRLKFDADYRLSGTRRFYDASSADIYHRLSARGEAELVEDWLFLNADARVGQQNINLSGRQAIDNVTDGGNRTGVATVIVNPYIKRRLGTLGTADAGYTRKATLFSEDSVGDASRDSFRAGFESGTGFDDLYWKLDFTHDANHNSTSPDTTFQRYLASAAFALTRKFRLTASAGYDKNDYDSRGSTGGASWNGGFQWAPSRRTTLGANLGQRYFGRTLGMNLSHRYRRGLLQVSYTEDVRDGVSSVDVAGFGYSANCPGGSVTGFDPGGSLSSSVHLVLPISCKAAYDAGAVTISGQDVVLDAIVAGVYISRIWSASSSYETLRHKLSLTLSTSEREFEADPTNDSSRVSLTGGWTWKLGVHTDARLALSQSVVEQQAGGQDYDLWHTSWALEHEFQPRLSGALTLLHQEKSTVLAADEYQESRVSALVKMEF